MTQKVIDSFRGPYAFLSNFQAVDIDYEGLTYPSVEHAFQSAKTLDLFDRRRFTVPTISAGLAKGMGKRLKLRPDWEWVKLPIMLQLLEIKFMSVQYRGYYGKMLLNTGEAPLIEGHVGDDFWGVVGGKGENWLGEMLMDIRRRLREEGL